MLWECFQLSSEGDEWHCISNLYVQKLNWHRHARHDTDMTVLFCCAWCGGVNWVGSTASLARQVRSVSGLCRSVSGGAMRPLDALGHRTHLSGRLNSHRHNRHDKTRPSRLPVDGRRDAGQADRHARPRPHAATLYTSQNNFFTKRHTTRVIYRLTVQTLPDVCGTVYRLL